MRERQILFFQSSLLTVLWVKNCTVHLAKNSVVGARTPSLEGHILVALSNELGKWMKNQELCTQRRRTTWSYCSRESVVLSLLPSSVSSSFLRMLKFISSWDYFKLKGHFCKSPFAMFLEVAGLGILHGEVQKKRNTKLLVLICLRMFLAFTFFLTSNPWFHPLQSSDVILVLILLESVLSFSTIAVFLVLFTVN